MINNVIDHGMTVVEAVSAPRWHWEDRVIEMEPRIYHHLRSALEAKGLSLKCAKFSYDPAFSVQNSILIDPRSGRLYGGGDPRGGCGVATA
jgi:gamma-glutamyltranspeptidase